MKRALRAATLLAGGLLLGAASPASAQDVPERSSGGELTVGVLGAEDVASSKFTEYRDVPEGVFVPSFHLFSRNADLDFALFGHDVRQDDQRYSGWLDTSAFDLSFDYSQVPHDMGNDGRTILTELSEGVWGMSDALQISLGGAVDATPTAGRNVAFYDALLASSFASAGSVDVSSTRKRGTVAVDLGKKLPFDLTLSYMRELKSGYRGEGGGGVYSAVSSVVEVPDPLHDLTQEFGVRAAYHFGRGNIHAAFVRSVYDNRAETLTVDNPFQGVDAPYVSTPAPARGGGSQARWINAPDNEASTGSFGFLLKLARQTRIGADVSLGRWTQDAPFYPYTVNTAVLTPSGARADSVSALPQASLDGKINTTTISLTASSRPLENLSLRAQFRRYDLTNKTDRFVVTGDVGGSPDRSWSAVTASADAPYGHATANVYDTRTTRFTASASYDIGDLTVEGQVRTAKLERTSREAEEGKDNGFAFSALYHPRDWLGVRGTYDQAKRTAEGHTVYGFQADEAERETKRAGFDLELTPISKLALTVAYFRRHVEYTDRPDRIALSSGVPVAGAQPIPDTPSGLLEANYDSFTGEVSFRPGERAELSAYYTYEKDATTNQWATTTGVNLNNLLNYAGRDQTDTFGFHGVFELEPEVWTLTVSALRQKVDGLMDITAREAGSFYTPGRTTLVSAGTGGAQDIVDWDDTELTTVTAQVDYAAARDWTLSAGFLYEKYDFRDAYTAGDLLMPQSVLLFLKSNDGAYEGSVLYAKVNYRF